MPTAIVLSILILLFVALLAFVLRTAKRQANAQREPATVTELGLRRRLTALRQLFHSSSTVLRENMHETRGYYRTPWILLLGAPKSGKTALLDYSGLNPAVAPRWSSLEEQAGVAWRYFNGGVVLDIAGDYLSLGAETSDRERTWSAILRQLQRYRPRRPADGVLLTLAAPDLLAARATVVNEVLQAGDMAHKRLWQAQNAFGIRLPVYVVITLCDAIEGFASFVRALPPERRSEMLGWSSPYALEVPYAPEWVDAALDEIGNAITCAQAEILANGEAVSDVDAQVLLPRELGSLRNALKAYLNQLLRPSSYHESFYLRGVYLTGATGAADQSASTAAQRDELEPSVSYADDGSVHEHDAPASAIGSIAFVRDLLDKKVFVELGIARPIQRAWLARGRTASVLRWSAVAVAAIWGFGLLYANHELNDRLDRLGLMRALESIHETQLARDSGSRKGATTLLDQMELLETYNLQVWSLPSSLNAVNDLDEDVKKSFIPAWRVIFGWTTNELARKGDALAQVVDDESQNPIHRSSASDSTDGGTAGIFPAKFEQSGRAIRGLPGPAIDLGERDWPVCTSDDANKSAATPMIAVKTMPEFKALESYVKDVADFDRAVATLTRVKTAAKGDLNDVRAVIAYSSGLELPADFSEKADYYRGALHDYFALETAHPMTAGKYRQAPMRARFCRLYQRLSCRLLDDNAVAQTGEALAGTLQDLRYTKAAADLPARALKDLRQKLDTLAGLLNDPGAGWIAPNDTAPQTVAQVDPALRGLLENVDPARGKDETGATLSGVAAECESNAGDRSAAGYRILQQRLHELASGAHPIMSASNGRWALSAEMQNLSKALPPLLANRFMANLEPGTLDVNLSSQERIRWDVDLLDQALGLADEQRRDLKETLPKFPDALRGDVRRIADRQLALRMEEIVVRAQSVQTVVPGAGVGDALADLSEDIANFDHARPRLVRLLATLNDLEANLAYDNLARVVSREATRRLALVDSALMARTPYAMQSGDFSWWQGGKNPTGEAFGVSDAQGLEDYLGRQLAQVESLSKLSMPLVALLDSTDARLDRSSLRILQKWRRINAELDKFRNKNPSSSAALLDNFIRTDLSALDSQTCLDKLNGSPHASRATDFFLERETVIREAAYVRCAELTITQQTKAYAELELAFNQWLAGHFPFGQRAAGADISQADAGDVAKFLRLYDRDAKTSPALLKSKPAAQKFLDDLSQVRAFLAPLLAPDDAASAPAYDINVDFRVSRPTEVDGNKIIDWILQVGDQTIRLGDANRRAKWRPGMPVVLTLRWAKDAQGTPVYDSEQPQARVAGKSIIYEYDDAWALVSLLQDHAASSVDLAPSAEKKPHVLKFEFATESADANGKPSLNAKRAKVFVRLAVTPAGKTDVLKLPVFPVLAPPLDAQTRIGMSSGDPPAR